MPPLLGPEGMPHTGQTCSLTMAATVGVVQIGRAASSQRRASRDIGTVGVWTARAIRGHDAAVQLTVSKCIAGDLRKREDERV